MPRQLAKTIIDCSMNYAEPPVADHPKKRDHHLWSIILAGGEGKRIQPMVKRWLGRNVPKQYCTFVGTRSMLQHTLARADQLTLPERKVIVIARSHCLEDSSQAGEYHCSLKHPCDFCAMKMGECLFGTTGSTDGSKVIRQPANCGTAPGVFLPLSYVLARDPDAKVVIHPSDHFVFPERLFVEVIQSVVQSVERWADRLVLLGIMPDRLDLDFGWMNPGKVLGHYAGHDLWSVDAFTEKPTLCEAKAAMACGALWNTMVLAASAATIWRLGWRCLPKMMPRFQMLLEAIGTTAEEAVLERVYGGMPVRNFSTDLLARATDQIAVIEASGILWNDWGRPDRIVDSLGRIGKQPRFPARCLVVE